MRKTTPLLALAALAMVLAGCASSGGGLSEGEAEQTRAMLVQAGQDALIATENSLFQDASSLEVPPSCLPYTTGLPQFRAVLNTYMEAMAEVLRTTSAEATDYLFEAVSALDFSDAGAYLEAGYSSVTEALQETGFDTVSRIYASAVEASSPEADAAWEALLTEARIWRENQANLAKVGQGAVLFEIEPMDPGTAGRAAAEAHFTLLSENEVTARRALASGEAR